MNVEQAKEIIVVLKNEDLEAAISETYSGRAMYGKTCVAIITDHVAAVGWAAGKIGMWWDDVPKRTDNLGLSQVVY